MFGSDGHRADPRVRLKLGQGQLRRALPGGSRGQVDDPVLMRLGQRLERRKHGGHGFAAAGRRLRKQCLAIAQAPVYRGCQLALARPELGERKLQVTQVLIAGRPVQTLGGQPIDHFAERGFKKAKQHLTWLHHVEVRRRQGVGVNVDQPH